MKRVCVFCGSNFGARSTYRKAAEEFGTRLAKRGLGLVYGGAHVGLMGAVADAAFAAGGEVIGVIPKIPRRARSGPRRAGRPARRGRDARAQGAHGRTRRRLCRAAGQPGHVRGVFRDFDVGATRFAPQAVRPAERGRIFRPAARARRARRQGTLRATRAPRPDRGGSRPAALLDRLAAYESAVGVPKWMCPPPGEKGK